MVILICVCSVCGTSIIIISPLPPSYVIKLLRDFTQYFKTFGTLIVCVMQVNSCSIIFILNHTPTSYKDEWHDNNMRTSQLKYKTAICCSYKQATSGRNTSECKIQRCNSQHEVNLNAACKTLLTVDIYGEIISPALGQRIGKCETHPLSWNVYNYP
jgi:hypothetical protein